MLIDAPMLLVVNRVLSLFRNRFLASSLKNFMFVRGTPVQEPAPEKLIYCESGRIGPYFLDFSANRTNMHLQIEKIWPRFPTFSLRSFLPHRLLARSSQPAAEYVPKMILS